MMRSPEGASTIEIASGDCSTTVIRRLCSACTLLDQPFALDAGAPFRRDVAKENGEAVRGFILMSNQWPGTTSNSNGIARVVQPFPHGALPRARARHPFAPQLPEQLRPTMEEPPHRA